MLPETTTLSGAPEYAAKIGEKVQSLRNLFFDSGCHTAFAMTLLGMSKVDLPDSPTIGSNALYGLLFTEKVVEL